MIIDRYALLRFSCMNTSLSASISRPGRWRNRIARRYANSSSIAGTPPGWTSSETVELERSQRGCALRCHSDDLIMAAMPVVPAWMAGPPRAGGKASASIIFPHHLFHGVQFLGIRSSYRRLSPHDSQSPGNAGDQGGGALTPIFPSL